MPLLEQLPLSKVMQFCPIGDGAIVTVFVFGLTRRAQTLVPCTFVQCPGRIQTVRSA